MPKRTDIQSILVIGSGPIVIGQACEFDYAGTQACKALKEEGYRIILVNSNPATIMTDPQIADATYIEPITREALTAIIAQEKPDALLPTLGGQTALNCTLELCRAGILAQYSVQLIGASLEAIECAEDRFLFQNKMKSIGLSMPWTKEVNSFKEAEILLKQISLPVIIRSSFSLGGASAGIATSHHEFIQLCQQAFQENPHQTIAIDEALIGWKEFELEVIRDHADNCIVVCGVENLDPLGIHTGDSITVAPIQTLTDKEYQAMRQDAFSVLRAIGVDTGGSNVQFAVHPKTGRRVIIEMNPRVSRSSALVSKATGFPIAKIAAKLAVGYTLDELKNEITGDQLPASFEPTIDYVVVKIPRFNIDKFPESGKSRGPKMRSIGEVMSMGRTFPEALQKAIRSLELGKEGLSGYESIPLSELKAILSAQGALQIFAVGEAFRRNMTLEEVHTLTHIDPWFLDQIARIIQKEIRIPALPSFQDDLKDYKRWGFSDARLAKLLGTTEAQITQLRYELNIMPVYKRVDSCAGEFPTETAYFYSTYEQVCEAAPSLQKKILIIGSGPNRIGQGIEFDYCCVQAATALKQLGYETIMLNCNPETVSTDYDVVDRLYCTPLTLEDVLSIIHLEKPMGVLVQYGGQTPLLLAEKLQKSGVPLLGVDLEVIKLTENREQFKTFLESLSLKQPRNVSINTLESGLNAAKVLGFPLIIRPSFVLGGSSMSIVNNDIQLKHALQKALSVSTENPSVLVEQFLEQAIEIDVDALSDGSEVWTPGLLEHIENAGVHSGDSACITPAYHLPADVQTEIYEQTKKIGQHLNIRGAFNIQFAFHKEALYVLEVNPRVSRTLPFWCKVTGLPLVAIATNCSLGIPLASQSLPHEKTILSRYFVKEAVFPFSRFPESLPILGPEMRSTGEVMGIGNSPAEAYAKAQLAAGNILPASGNAFLIADPSWISSLNLIGQSLLKLGFTLYADADCSSALKFQHITMSLDRIPDPVNLVISLIHPTEQYPETLKAAQHAVMRHILYTTTPEAALMLTKALEFHLLDGNYHYQSLQIGY